MIQKVMANTPAPAPAPASTQNKSPVPEESFYAKLQKQLNAKGEKMTEKKATQETKTESAQKTAVVEEVETQAPQANIAAEVLLSLLPNIVPVPEAPIPTEEPVTEQSVLSVEAPGTYETPRSVENHQVNLPEKTVAEQAVASEVTVAAVKQEAKSFNAPLAMEEPRQAAEVPAEQQTVVQSVNGNTAESPDRQTDLPADTSRVKAQGSKAQLDEKAAPDEHYTAFTQRLNELGYTFKAASQLPVAHANAETQAPVPQQVATGVLNAFQNGKTEFTMKLQPEELGDVLVKMVMEQGKISLHIVTATEQSAKLIEGQMSSLRTALKETNLQMESCTVENQSFNNLGFGQSFSTSDNSQQDRQALAQHRAFSFEQLADEQDVAGTVGLLEAIRASAVLNRYA